MAASVLETWKNYQELPPHPIVSFLVKVGLQLRWWFFFFFFFLHLSKVLVQCHYIWCSKPPKIMQYKGELFPCSSQMVFHTPVCASVFWFWPRIRIFMNGCLVFVEAKSQPIYLLVESMRWGRGEPDFGALLTNGCLLLCPHICKRTKNNQHPKALPAICWPSVELPQQLQVSAGQNRRENTAGVLTLSDSHLPAVCCRGNTGCSGLLLLCGEVWHRNLPALPSSLYLTALLVQSSALC